MEHNFKCEGQGTQEQFDQYNTRLRKINSLERKWKPYQHTLDKLKEQYDNAVQAVREQAKYIDDEIKQLKQDNTDNCPHPVQYQEYKEDHLYHDWEKYWDIHKWTTCSLCGKRPKDETDTHR